MLEVRELHVGYDNRPVLRCINLSLKPGDVVALLGTNGAGKSTLLRCLAGALRQQSGSIKLEGEEISSWTAWKRTRHGLALVPEGQQSFPGMTVWENLWVGTEARPEIGRAFQQHVEEVFDIFPRLAERRNQPAGTLSGGERQMLAVGRAIIARPRILMLDEPSHGLAPLLVEQVAEMVQVIASTTIVLVAEQNLLIPSRCATNVVVLENSRIVMEGPPPEVLASDFVTTTYLGL